MSPLRCRENYDISSDYGMLTAPSTPERLRKLLEDCAATPGGGRGPFAAVVVRYAATREPVDALLQPWPWSMWEIREMIEVAASLYESDELAARFAEIAVLNIGRAHAFVPHFFLEALAAGVKRPSEGLLRVAERCGVPREKLAAEIALSSRDVLAFGWQGNWSRWDTIGKRRSIDLNLRIAPRDATPGNAYERFVLETEEAALSPALLEIVSERGSGGDLNESAISVLAAFRPAAVTALMERARTTGGLFPYGVWGHVLKLTGRWDEVFLEAAAGLDPGERLELLDVLRRTGRLTGLPAGIAMAREAALDPQQPYPIRALLFLADFGGEDFEREFRRAIDEDRIEHDDASEEAFAAAARQWEGAGQRIYRHVLARPEQAGTALSYHSFGRQVRSALIGLLTEARVVPDASLRHWFREALRLTGTLAPTTRERNSSIDYFWLYAQRRACDAVAGEFLELLASSAQGLREHAVKALPKCSPERVLPTVLKMLTSRRADSRQGAAELLLALADPAHVTALAQALSTETTSRVRQALHEAMTACSTAALNAGRAVAEEQPRETPYLPRSGKLKLPSADWLRIAELPALFHKDGTELDAAAVTDLIVTQGAHKSIAPSPDLLPLLARLDRSRSAGFASELLARYLAAGAPVEDRWAMALAGMLGDATVIPPLQARIPDWCQERRYKLAEYAAQALALLPGNEPLAALDALSKRYRQKFRNVGLACETACSAAAKRRGLSGEELKQALKTNPLP